MKIEKQTFINFVNPNLDSEKITKPEKENGGFAAPSPNTSVSQQEEGGGVTDGSVKTKPALEFGGPGNGGYTTQALGEEGGSGDGFTTQSLGEEGGTIPEAAITKTAKEEGDASFAPGLTTDAIGEEGGSGDVSTQALGEEGGDPNIFS